MADGLQKYSGGNQITATAGRDMTLFDLKQAYNTYKKVYDATTGKSWTEDKWMGRAKNWLFFGNSRNFVAARPQQSGGYKLVNIAADPDDPNKDADLRGALAMMLAQNKPTWGLVSKNIAVLARRAKFLILTPELVLDMFSNHMGFDPIIPRFVVTDYNSSYDVNPDGSITVHDDELGTLDPKNVICNDRWIDHSIMLIGERIKKIMNVLPGGVAQNMIAAPGASNMPSGPYREKAFLEAVIKKLQLLEGDSTGQIVSNSPKQLEKYESKFIRKVIK